MQVALSQMKSLNLLALLRLLRQWWLEEFANLLPAGLAKWISEPGRAVLLAAINGESVTLELLSGEGASIALEQIEPSAVTAEFVERFFKVNQVDPRGADIGVQLSEQSIFRRELQLPIEAARTIEAVAIQDLVKKTPFRPDDIYSDYVATLQDNGRRILVQQWIVQRKYVEDALSPLNIGIEKVTFVTCRAGGPDQRRPVIKLKKEDVHSVWLEKLTLILSCSALILALFGGGLKYWSQHQEMDRLATEVTTANKKAQEVRALVDQLQKRKSVLVRLRLQRSEMPGVIDLWDEITGILPNHTWLSEFRLSETPGQQGAQISISGLSNAAPGLVGIIDGSPMFTDAALTSPVAFDSVEGQERFSLQARVKMPEVLKEAAR